MWYTGVVWAGPSVFPDWFAPNTQDFWNKQFDRFFNAQNGLDIDGLWIRIPSCTQSKAKIRRVHQQLVCILHIKSLDFQKTFSLNA